MKKYLLGILVLMFFSICVTSVVAEEKNNLLRTVIKDITYHRETEVRDKWHPVPFFLDISLI